MSERVIVVATDGMPCGSAAVEWAASEASIRGCALRIVHAYTWDRRESQFDIGNEDVDVARVLAAAVVDDAYQRARALAPDADIWTDTLIGPLLPRLLESSRTAEMLVVGGEVVRDAPCPVVVVRSERHPVA
ncbi:universal stress protein [Actinoplanes sp. LDG1-06]|uniref:Universal stress protein n=1 Tax=Paractinoplanes ovalisporus TaxID=2810368 RepID=A0ABS2A3N9_9ACTN|nr:universal stress protein [Actinoplanes ovalisporus]MBM2614463.1 universal stress protein [Actinoplanes ovalisporus]